MVCSIYGRTLLAGRASIETRSVLERGQYVPESVERGLGLIVQVEFPQGVTDVGAHCGLTDEQLLAIS